MLIRYSIINICRSIELASKQPENPDIASLCRIASERVRKYAAAEKSPKAKRDMLQLVERSFKALSLRELKVKPWYGRVLSHLGLSQSAGERRISETVRKVQTLLGSSYFDYAGRLLRQFAVTLIEWPLSTLLRAALDSDPLFRLKQCAFRTLKDIGMISSLFLDSKLQGDLLTQSLRTIIADLRAFKAAAPELAKAKCDEVIGALTRAVERHQRIEGMQLRTRLSLLRADEAELADFAYDVERAVERLQVGQSELLTGGYIADGAGHAVTYKVLCRDEACYEFSLRNTGDGAEQGQGIFGAITMLFSGKVYVPTFSPLSLAAVTDRAFHIDLVKSVVVKTEAWFPMHGIFQMIKKHLVETHGATQEKREQHALQSWGTCSFDAVMSYLEHEFEPWLFLSFQLFMMKRAKAGIDALLPDMKSSLNALTVDLLSTKPQETIQKSREAIQSYIKSHLRKEQKLSKWLRLKGPDVQQAIQAQRAAIADLEGQKSQLHLWQVTQKSEISTRVAKLQKPLTLIAEFGEEAFLSRLKRGREITAFVERLVNN